MKKRYLTIMLLLCFGLIASVCSATVNVAEAATETETVSTNLKPTSYLKYTDINLVNKPFTTKPVTTTLHTTNNVDAFWYSQFTLPLDFDFSTLTANVNATCGTDTILTDANVEFLIQKTDTTIKSVSKKSYGFVNMSDNPPEYENKFFVKGIVKNIEGIDVWACDLWFNSNDYNSLNIILNNSEVNFLNKINSDNFSFISLEDNSPNNGLRCLDYVGKISAKYDIKKLCFSITQLNIKNYRFYMKNNMFENVETIIYTDETQDNIAYIYIINSQNSDYYDIYTDEIATRNIFASVNESVTEPLKKADATYKPVVVDPVTSAMCVGSFEASSLDGLEMKLKVGDILFEECSIQVDMPGFIKNSLYIVFVDMKSGSMAVVLGLYEKVKDDLYLITIYNVEESPDFLIKEFNGIAYNPILKVNYVGINVIEYYYRENITMPEAPKKEGYTFENWYKDEAFTEVYDFGNEIKQSIDIYPKFNLNSYNVVINGGANPVEIIVNYGEKITVPEAPIKEGYTFENWYKDEALTEVYNFNDIVKSNLNLYPKFNLNTFKIIFKLDLPVEIIVNHGENITMPEAPKKEGYTFENWYKDEALTEVYDFSTIITEEKILYPKFEKVIEISASSNVKFVNFLKTNWQYLFAGASSIFVLCLAGSFLWRLKK